MKIKTNSSAKKRFKVTGTGKLKANKAAKRHLLLQKSKKQKRKGKIGIQASPGDIKILKRAMPGKIKRRKIKTAPKAPAKA